MADLAMQLQADRAQRNAAMAICKADIAFIRKDLQERGIGERVTDRLTEGAADMAEDAVQYAQDNPYKVAGGFAVAALWLAFEFFWRPEGGKEPENRNQRLQETDPETGNAIR